MEASTAAPPLASMNIRRFDSAGSAGDVLERITAERACTAESVVSVPPSPARESSRGFGNIPPTPESPGFGAMQRGYFSEEGDEEVDEVLDYHDELASSPSYASRYPMSPLRSPSVGGVGDGVDNMYASQTMSEVSEIEEDLDEGGLDEEEYHSSSLGKPVAIRPMRLSPDFFTGFGRASHRGPGHSRGSNGGLDSPATPGMADDKPQCVLPGLFIGSLEAARNIEALAVAGITHVLTLGMGMDLPQVEGRLESHRVVAVEDKVSEQTSLATHLNECMDYIHECRSSGGKVLVHCLAGRSRSASIVAAYLMVQNKCSVDEAIMQLRLVRPWIAPNAGFMNMLRAFQDNPTFSMPTQAEPEPEPDRSTPVPDVRASSSDSEQQRRQADDPETAKSARSASAASSASEETGDDGGSSRGASLSPRVRDGPEVAAAAGPAGSACATSGGDGAAAASLQDADLPAKGDDGIPIAGPLVGLPSAGMSGGFDPS
jgi:protein-tyrosine phosphatase